MSRVITELEASDIRIGEGGDLMHSAVSAAVLVGSINLTFAKPGADPDELLKKVTASALNSLSRSGFSVVKSELPVEFAA